MSQDPFGTIPMFEVPEKYRPPAKPPKKIVWTAYKGARTSCCQCVLNIAKGTNRHFSDSASKVRTTPTSRDYYCYRHGYEQELQDDMASRSVTEREG